MSTPHLPPVLPPPPGRGPWRNIGLLVISGTAALMLAFAIWSGGLIPNAPPRAMYPVRGIDISHHQKDIAWDRIDPEKTRFAYIKATEGADFKDTKFAQNWEGAELSGIRRGAYHFFTLGTPGAQQAANFIAAVPIDENALPPGIDLEMSGYNRGRTQAPADFQRELDAFSHAVAKHYAKTPVIYTTNDFRRQFMHGYKVERLWIRDVVWWPQPGWTFWQFSPRGRLRGISTAVDFNVFNGDAESFESFISLRVDSPTGREKPTAPKRKPKPKKTKPTPEPKL